MLGNSLTLQNWYQRNSIFTKKHDAGIQITLCKTIQSFYDKAVFEVTNMHNKRSNWTNKSAAEGNVQQLLLTHS